jgi:hypothetical protein
MLQRGAPNYLILARLTPTTALQASSKGLKLYLTADSNQGSQDGTIQTSQYDRVVDDIDKSVQVFALDCELEERNSLGFGFMNELSNP